MNPPAERILAAATARPSARRSLTVVVPVHDEEAVLGAFLDRLLPVLGGLGLDWDILAVDDGSGDGSLALLRARAAAEPRLRILCAWNFALDGIVGFSSAPLRVWLYVGTAVSALAVAGSLWLALRGPAYAPELPGLLIVILLLGGLQLLVLGLMGEYLGRMHGETKHRPLYVVADAVGIDLEAGLSGPAR